ncbi:MAG TPA: ABC transporter ATP-binding protein [Candidatus Eisenbacteria bacterium]|nr:ABC transporter ATP-binding protein [Candidatus Eisenbacteria bacterium]
MVEVSLLRKQFSTEQETVKALRGISFSVPEGQLVTLLGPSGCGKTTTLRCVAGLERPDSGMIRIGERVVYSSESKQFDPPEWRPVGMVFQSYAIWPHMTVFDNVAYPLRGRGVGKTRIVQEVHRVLSLVGLAELADRPSPQLSGGQQQRVAVARALVANPSVLLLDEPLSNLDAKLRQHMRLEIRELQKRSGITAIYVTHDQEEAMAVSDQILFMVDGEIVEGGPPQEIYRKPQKKLTAEFFGEANFVRGRIKAQEGDRVVVETPLGTLSCAGQNKSVGQEAYVFFRPEDAEVVREPPCRRASLPGHVARVTFLGKTVECLLELENGVTLKASVHPKFRPRQAETVHLVVNPDACSVVTD